MSRVALVGAGAVGTRTALDLADHGVAVTLFERGEIGWDGETAVETPGDAASSRAAGVLYDAYAEDVDAALGARSLERFRAFDGTEGFLFHECPYAILVREGDDERAAATRRAVERMREHDRQVETLAPEQVGERFPTLHADDLAVAAVADNAGWADTGAYVAALLTTARAAGVEIRDETPVTLASPTTVATPGGRESFDAVVVAAGAHTAQVCAGVDVDLAAVPYRVQALTGAVVAGSPGSGDGRVGGDGGGADEGSAGGGGGDEGGGADADDSPHGGDPHPGPMWYDATAGVYARPHPDGILAGDGTVPEATDPDAWDREADDWFVADTREVAAHRLRGSAAATGDSHEASTSGEPTGDTDATTTTDPSVSVERSWAGVCTATPDGDPLLGHVRDGLYVATGWQGHGFMRSPAHAELLAELVAADLGVATASPASVPSGETALSAFDPTRFPAGVEFEVREGMLVEER
ncbi:NAD(P)/FAD-dependent oxidoreductase [Halobaculum sp. MBLA0147]|uniref:NAD(P)/FAD-dependent oxidoreductase n=1 Tax=Halobaculum sp. MBLA0147 TaxID=3079934 RepID=UPI00352617ED